MAKLHFIMQESHASILGMWEKQVAIRKVYVRFFYLTNP